MKELLNPDNDESSRYEDDSVTTHDEDFPDTSHNNNSQTPPQKPLQKEEEETGTSGVNGNGVGMVKIDASSALRDIKLSGEGASESESLEHQSISAEIIQEQNQDIVEETIESKGSDEVSAVHKDQASDTSDFTKDEASARSPEESACDSKLIAEDGMETEEDMDAESEVEEIVVDDDEFDEGNTMDDGIDMETTSVADDEELYKEEEEVEVPDQPMDREISPVIMDDGMLATAEFCSCTTRLLE